MGEFNQQRNLIFAGVSTVVLFFAAFFFTASDNGEPELNSETVQNSAPAKDDPSELPPKIDPIVEFDLVRISRGGTGVVAGKTLPGATVYLLADGVELVQDKADANGEWVIILDTPLDPGSREFSLKATLTDGTEIESRKVVVISVPERETERFLASKDTGVVAVMSSKDGKGGSEVLQKPGVAAFADFGDNLKVDTVDYGNGGATISGRSLPRVEVRVYLDGKYLGSTKVNDRGNWTIEIEQLVIAPGKHVMRVDQTAGEGDVKLRVEQPFELGQPIDPSLAENGVIVHPGNTLWHIARRLYGSGVRYTMIFRENSELIKDPNLIYPGQLFKLPAKPQTDDDGSQE